MCLTGTAMSAKNAKRNIRKKIWQQKKREKKCQPRYNLYPQKTQKEMCTQDILSEKQNKNKSSPQDISAIKHKKIVMWRTFPFADIFCVGHLCICRVQLDLTSKLYISFSLTDLVVAIKHMESCMKEIDNGWSWKMLNANTTVVLLIRAHFQNNPPMVTELTIRDCTVTCWPSARNLGVFFDEHLNMESRVRTICLPSSIHLRQISSIRDAPTRNQHVWLLIFLSHHNSSPRS